MNRLRWNSSLLSLISIEGSSNRQFGALSLPIRCPRRWSDCYMDCPTGLIGSKFDRQIALRSRSDSNTHLIRIGACLEYVRPIRNRK